MSFKKKVNPDLLQEQLKAAIGEDYAGLSTAPATEDVEVHLKEGVQYKKWEATINQIVSAHDANERSAKETQRIALETDARTARRQALDETPTLAKLLKGYQDLQKRIRYLETLMGIEE